MRRIMVVGVLSACGSLSPPAEVPVVVEVDVEPSVGEIGETDDDEQEYVREGLKRPAWTRHNLADEAAFAAGTTLSDKRLARKAYTRGVRAMKAGDHAAALGEFIVAHETFPGAAPKWRVATSLDKLGRFNEAVLAYRWFIASDPGPKYQARVDEATARIALLEPKGTPVRVAMARDLFEVAVREFGSANYAEAKRAFAKAYALSPKPAILLNVAICDQRLGHKRTACVNYASYLKDARNAHRDPSLDALCGTGP